MAQRPENPLKTIPEAESDVTEEEAKTKACCKGSQFSISENGPCIASECMAWRAGAKMKFRDGRSGNLLDRDLTGHGVWVTVGGYCGLAGAPQ